MVRSSTTLTIQEFFELPEGDRPYELIDGQAIPKMSPKFFHSRLQKTLLFIFDSWGENKGRVEPEWAIKLKRHGVDWIPVPDLTYISYNRLSADWMLDEACPVAPELVIEIISPGQTFDDLVGGNAASQATYSTPSASPEKATDYLQAGVARVWLIDTKVQSITIFYGDTLPKTIKGTTAIADDLFPELKLSPQQIFQQAGLIN
ncbi:MAG: Uma2 family endonuclease [Waterburya sp.]